jgi:hypothetical protein
MNSAAGRPAAVDGGAPHGRRRVLAAVGGVTLLSFAVGSYSGTFGHYGKSMGTSPVTKKHATPSGIRRTNRTNSQSASYDNNQQPENHSPESLHDIPSSSSPPLSSSIPESPGAEQGRGGSAAVPLPAPGQTPHLCERRHIVDGMWLPEHLKDGPPYMFPSNETRCDGPVGRYYSKQGWDTFRWVPNDSIVANSSSINSTGNGTAPCHFTTWNKTLFCELAKHATITIIGDSLSWEHYISLVLLLGVPTHHGYQHMSRLHDVNVGHAVCDGLARIVYRRDDDLSKLRNAVLEGGGESSNGSFIPQVLVVNRGAHYKGDAAYMKEWGLALDVVEEWLGWCDEMKIKCHFFWRTTVPGHHHCRAFKRPVNDIAAMEAHVANLSLYDANSVRYHWYDFRRQNLLAEAELDSRHANLPHRVLDGYRINLLRPDGHLRTDCLHSCYPGKMDVYPQLLLHYLRGDRSLEDVARLRTVHDEQRWNLNVTTVYDARPGPA